MGMLDEDGEILNKHLRKKTSKGLGKCPMCDHLEWQMLKHRSGMLSHVDTGQGEPELSAKDVLPLVHIICTNCYFVASFAWKAVLAESKRGG